MVKFYQLDHLPSAAQNTMNWKVQGLKLLCDSKLSVPKSFILTDIKNESDVETAVQHYENSGLDKVILRPCKMHGDEPSSVSLAPEEATLCPEDPAQFKHALDCCLNTFHRQSAKHRPHFFSDTSIPGLCVIVQQLLDADIFGVCQTEASEGDEATLVRARTREEIIMDTHQATPHTYSVRELDHQYYILNPADDDLLSSTMLTRIAKDAETTTANLHFPLSLEFAIADGDLYWLQANPIDTAITLSATEFDTDPIEPNHVFTSLLMSNLFAGAITPLTQSTVVAAFGQSIKQAFVKYKVVKRIEDLPKNIGLASINNHLFFNASQLGELAVKQPDGFKELLDFSFCAEVLDDGFSRCWDFSLTDFVVFTSKYFGANNLNVSAFQKISQLAESFTIALADKSLSEQMAEVDQKLAVLDSAFADYFTIFSTAHFMSTALYRIFIKALMVPERARALMLECLSDIPNIQSMGVVTSLTTLAREMVLDNPRIVDYSLDEIKKALLNVSGESKSAYEAFIAQHGCRGFYEMELKSRPWQDSQDKLAIYLRSIFTTNLSEAGLGPRVPSYIATIEDRFEPKVAASIKSFVEQARSAIALWDSAQSGITRMLSQFKAAYQMLGQQMTKKSIIPQSDLVFFMTHSELLNFVTKNDFDPKRKIAVHPSLVKQAFARKQAYNAQRELAFGRLYFGKPAPLEETLTPPKGGAFKGRCSTPGVLVGKARVLLHLCDLAQVKSGEILVTPLADIGLAPYFNMAGALITESGSELSQAAIIARDLGLPHVTDVKLATRFIKTGDTLSVSATTGEVKILS